MQSQLCIVQTKGNFKCAWPLFWDTIVFPPRYSLSDSLLLRISRMAYTSKNILCSFSKPKLNVTEKIIVNDIEY